MAMMFNRQTNPFLVGNQPNNVPQRFTGSIFPTQPMGLQAMAPQQAMMPIVQPMTEEQFRQQQNLPSFDGLRGLASQNNSMVSPAMNPDGTAMSQDEAMQMNQPMVAPQPMGLSNFNGLNQDFLRNAIENYLASR